MSDDHKNMVREMKRANREAYASLRSLGWLIIFVGVVATIIIAAMVGSA